MEQVRIDRNGIKLQPVVQTLEPDRNRVGPGQYAASITQVKYLAQTLPTSITARMMMHCMAPS